MGIFHPQKRAIFAEVNEQPVLKITPIAPFMPWNRFGIDCSSLNVLTIFALPYKKTLMVSRNPRFTPKNDETPHKTVDESQKPTV